MFRLLQRRVRRGKIEETAVGWKRWVDSLLILMSGCLLTIWLAWSVMAYMDSYKFDSGWVRADNKQDNVIRIPHNLRLVPTELTLWFSPTATGETAYLVTQWNVESTGNPVTISADRLAITLAIWRGAPVRGVWSPATSWKQYAEGYYKVVAK